MWGNLGNAQRLTPGREAAAREALERATGLMQERLQHDPSDAMGWARLGGWLLGLGQREESLAAVRRATELAPRDGTVWSSAGHTLFLAGDRDTALVALAAAVEHGYGVDALRRSRELAPLRGDVRFQRILASHSPDEGGDSGSNERGGV
jgi:Flp pilus assembly protein TadD